MDDGKALIFLNSVQDTDQLVRGGTEGLGRAGWSISPWSPECGSVNQGKGEEIMWILIEGLPFHLWTTGIFSAIGSLCGGLIGIADLLVGVSNFKVARIRVRQINPAKIPRSVVLIDQGFSFQVILKPEFSPSLPTEGKISISPVTDNRGRQPIGLEERGERNLLYGSSSNSNFKHTASGIDSGEDNIIRTIPYAGSLTNLEPAATFASEYPHDFSHSMLGHQEVAQLRQDILLIEQMGNSPIIEIPKPRVEASVSNKGQEGHLERVDRVNVQHRDDLEGKAGHFGLNKAFEGQGGYFPYVSYPDIVKGVLLNPEIMLRQNKTREIIRGKVNGISSLLGEVVRHVPGV